MSSLEQAFARMSHASFKVVAVAIFSKCAESMHWCNKKVSYNPSSSNPSGSGSSCLTFHLHYYPCSQAWSCHSSLMVVSFLFLFLHSHTFFLVIPNLEIVEMNQRVTPKFSLFNDFCFQLPYLVTLLGANLFPPFDFQCMQMFPFCCCCCCCNFGKKMGIH